VEPSEYVKAVNTKRIPAARRAIGVAPIATRATIPKA
jgi:hypothetical protein